MSIDRHWLGVDFGTSNTVAILGWPDGRTRPLLFDGSPQLPSAVFAEPEGRLLVGASAIRAGRAYPERLEPYPKRCIDQPAVYLGNSPAVPVPALIEAVLRRVADEAARVTAGAALHVVLAHPAGWGTPRRSTLLATARRVFADLALVPEPVAAASHFVASAGRRMPVGRCAVVYDLGAGTFDASVVRRTDQGFEVLATAGLVDAGGLDIDAAIVAELGGVYATRDPATWSRLVRPESTVDRQNNWMLWDDVRTGKEALSLSTVTTLHVPIFADTMPFGREEFDRLATPILERTVEVTRSVLDGSRVPVSAIDGLFLVGGASRIPLVATLLHRRLGVVPSAVEQPELAVAEGCVRAAILTTGRPAATPPPPAPPADRAPAAAGSGAPSGTGRPARVWAATAIGVAALSIVLLVAAVAMDGARGRGGGGPDPGGGDAGVGARPGSTVASLDPCLVGSWLVTDFQWTVASTYRVRGSGATVRIDRDGGFILDFGTATVFRGGPEMGAFRMIVEGTIRHDITTRDNRIHTRNSSADGTVTSDSGLPGLRPTEKLGVLPGPFDYRCANDAFTLTVDRDQSIEMSRSGG